MNIAKIIGIETEYGISSGAPLDPVIASGLIVNAFAQRSESRLRWDFQHETPAVDARNEVRTNGQAPDIEMHLANTVLRNGARLYVDHAHPEYSSPETRTPREAVLYDQAGEEIMRQALLAANERLPEGSALRLYKNNSDGKGNSYGTHENFLVDRNVPFADLVQALLPHFVSRLIVVGAGKVGSETDETRGLSIPFQIGARAEFFEEIVGIETTLRRPIINTRDEPHSDHHRFRRLHVINGDATMSPIATLLKVGVTSLLLAYVETKGTVGLPPVPLRPVAAFRAFARDLTLSVAVDTDDGQWTALRYQESLYGVLENFVRNHDTTSVAPPAEIDELLLHWRYVLDGLSDNREVLIDCVDWVAKWRLVEGFRQRDGLGWDDPKLKLIDVQYHDVDHNRSLARRAGLRQLFTPDDISVAVEEAPTSTRAYFRGQCIRRFPNELVSANWDSLVFSAEGGKLLRIPMDDPLRGTKERTEALFANNPTASELLVALSD